MWVPLLDDEHEDQREQHAKQSTDGSVILLVRVHESLRLDWVYPWSFGGCANRQRSPKKRRGRTARSIGGGDGLAELFAIVRGERPTEVQHLLEDVAGLEIGLDAREVDEASAPEFPLLEDREPE